VSIDLPAYTNLPPSLDGFVKDNGIISSLSVSINGALTVTPFLNQATGEVRLATLPVQQGLNTVLLSATDRAGNTGGAIAQTTLDTVPPRITFISPVPNQVVSAATVDITVSVQDASPTVVYIGNSIIHLPAGGGLASSQLPLSGTGTDNLSVVAVDAANNDGFALQTIFVDQSAPTVDVDIANGAILGPQPDDLLLVTVHVNDFDSTTVLVGPVSYDLGSGGGVVQAVVALVPGTNTFPIVVTGANGKSVSLARTVVYDTTPPLATITFPTANATIHGTSELSLQASDAVSGVARVSFQLDNLTPADATGASDQPWTLAFDTTALPDGAHTLSATVLDGAGNTTVVKTGFKVDNTPPTVRIAAPAPDAFVHGTISVDVEASDAGGVAEITLAANGTSIGSCAQAMSCVLSYDTARLPDGTLVITASAVDAAGNRAESVSVNLTTVNAVPPNFITNPIASQIVKGKTFVAIGSADPYFRSVECSVDGQSLGVSTNPNFTSTIDTLSKLDGPLVVSCQLRDVAGNVVTQTVTATIRNWTYDLDPDTLNLNSRGGPLSLRLTGRNLQLLLPLADKSLTLVVPGGSPVPLLTDCESEAHDVSHDGLSALTLRFDRTRFESSVRAGIASHAIDPKKPLLVQLFSGTRDLGGDSIRIGEW
jgi:hypothetical protein